MSLSTVSTTSFSYQPNYLSSNSHVMNGIVSPNNEELLPPEQKSTLQNSTDDMLSKQVDNIKSNYQSAKDLDLMRAYYQQQQKVLDIYIQTSTNTNSSSNSSNNRSSLSAVNTLTDTYATLYALHKSVKDGSQQLPVIPDDITQPTNPDDTLPANSRPMLNKQTDVYSSLMMPSNSSYLHLSA